MRATRIEVLGGNLCERNCTDTYQKFLLFEEDDEYFDQNDIIWATVYIGNGNIVEKVLDDETA